MTIQFRRGTNTARTGIILQDGEPGWTTDTKMLYIGDGSTYGGNYVNISDIVGTLAAAGSGISDAAQITVGVTKVSGADGTKGVKVSSAITRQTVINLNTSYALNVYPYDASHQINNLGSGTPYVLPASSAEQFIIY